MGLGGTGVRRMEKTEKKKGGYRCPVRDHYF
eukprot:CAMPEP_0171929126 /NCGR_PEP_ID=MMETSP0993-20121228/27343_1 /TAXON_ID=483369 /ORGANISM="non described non described, Strain CCMP2098" /LENGTH=30 /DNA_ID= /DNA_START= /DNA_END= /DNA_ORIENTATION=